jgi:hypothetical protein
VLSKEGDKKRLTASHRRQSLSKGGRFMNPWTCAALIAVSGSLGGVVNALLTDNDFILPRTKRRVWCPAVIANILVGTFAASSSWAF